MEMFERRFGIEPPWSLGVEEELFAVDAATRRPMPVPAAALDGSRLKAELFRSIVELATPVCATPAEAVGELRRLRARAGERLGEAGLALVASGTHPFGVLAEQEIVDDPGLQAFAAYAGPAARAQYCCGLHVHVSVPDAAACIEALEFVLPWLPVVLALSANSPYLEREETGYASTRAELLARLPRSAAPPAFDGFDDWERFARLLVSLGLADDYTRAWWDVRPHPRFGTLELRIADQPTSLATTGAFVALLQALVASYGGDGAGPADRGVYAQNRWAAQRFGVAAELIHPGGLRLATIGELTDELLALVEPAARRLGGAELLAPLCGLAGRSQADEQLELGRRAGLEALVADLAASTVPAFAPRRTG